MPERTAELITPRLRLRRPRREDVQAIHAIMSDPEAMKYWSTLPHASLDETMLWFNGMLAADRAGESDEYVIDYRGEVIGKVGAWRLRKSDFSSAAISGARVSHRRPWPHSSPTCARKASPPCWPMSIRAMPRAWPS